MNPQARRQGAMVARRIRHAGGNETAVIRRLATLKNSSGLVVTLALRGALSAGSLVLDLDAPGLSGTLPRRSGLSIGGESYTTLNEVEAAGGILEDVQISPALLADAADNAVVTVAQKYGDQTVHRMRSRSEAEREGSVEVEGFQRSVTGTAYPPQTGDLYLEGDRTHYVHKVHELGSAGEAGYRLELGEVKP